MNIAVNYADMDLGLWPRGLIEVKAFHGLVVDITDTILYVIPLSLSIVLYDVRGWYK